MTILGIYARHYTIIRKEFPSIEDAKSFLQHGADDGDLYGLAVLDTSNNQAWVPSLTGISEAREYIKNAEVVGRFETFP